MDLPLQVSEKQVGDVKACSEDNHLVLSMSHCFEGEG